MTLLKGRRRRGSRRPLSVSNSHASVPDQQGLNNSPRSPQRVFNKDDHDDYMMGEEVTSTFETPFIQDQNHNPTHNYGSYSIPHRRDSVSEVGAVDLEESTRLFSNVDLTKQNSQAIFEDNDDDQIDLVESAASRPRSLKAIKRYSGVLNLDEASMGSPLETRFNSPLHKNKSPSSHKSISAQAPPRNRFRHHRTNSSLGMSDEPGSSVGSLKRPLPFPQFQESMPGSRPFLRPDDHKNPAERRDSIETLFSDSPSKPPSVVQHRTSSPSPSAASKLHSSTKGHPYLPKHQHELLYLHQQNHHGQSHQEQQHQQHQQQLNISSGLSSTPAYKQVKPLQTAFLSAGLMSKRNRMNSDESDSSIISTGDSGIKTSTPMAAPTSVNKPSSSASPVFPNLSFGSGSSNYLQFSNFSSRNTKSIPDTPVKRPTPISTTPGVFGISRKNRGLRDSLLKFSMDFGNTSSTGAPTKDILDTPPMLGAVASRQSSNASTITSLDTPSHSHHRFFDQSSSSNMSSNVTNFMDSPQTPTLDITMQTDVDLFSNDSLSREEPRTPAKGHVPIGNKQQEGLDLSLTEKFDKVQLIGRGEFSMVYGVLVHNQGGATETKYAVKRTKYPYAGPKTRSRKLEEVEILRKLTMDRTSLSDLLSESESEVEQSEISQVDQEVVEQGREHIVHMLDAWEANNHLYIMTEFCDNGNLDTFLSERGNVSRLDEWRVWKILVEIALGMRYIHQQGFLHLDLKPANVFITFEGILKIGDFGMATKFPAPPGIEREGDREYIAPEVLTQQQYGTPADIFSLGMMMLEIAANIVLPDNGIHWQKLRSGDLSEAGRLSSGDLTMADDSMLSDHDETSSFDEYDVDDDDAATSSTIATTSGSSSSAKSSCGMDVSPDVPNSTRNRNVHLSNGNRSARRRHSHIPSWAPSFMVNDSGVLDNIVKWMLQPDPKARPSADQLLECSEVQWVESHRKAGAVIYEGDYGPEPEPDRGEHVMFKEEEWQSRI